MRTASDVFLKFSVGRDSVTVSRSFLYELLQDTIMTGGLSLRDGIVYMFGTKVMVED
jgi:hypothetical protein